VEAAPDEASRRHERGLLEALCLDYNMLKQRPAELEQSALPRKPDKP